MEQIQQHEWEGKIGNPYEGHSTCKHCFTSKIEIYGDGNLYDIKGVKTIYEPACITRPINAPASDKAE
jgi:hypothetical protein